jgi:hypothetical protein
MTKEELLNNKFFNSKLLNDNTKALLTSFIKDCPPAEFNKITKLFNSHFINLVNLEQITKTIKSPNLYYNKNNNVICDINYNNNSIESIDIDAKNKNGMDTNMSLTLSKNCLSIQFTNQTKYHCKSLDINYAKLTEFKKEIRELIFIYTNDNERIVERKTINFTALINNGEYVEQKPTISSYCTENTSHM